MYNRSDCEGKKVNNELKKMGNQAVLADAATVLLGGAKKNFQRRYLSWPSAQELNLDPQTKNNVYH